MNNLLLMEGDRVHVEYRQLAKGREVCLQPYETKFTEIKNPKAVYPFPMFIALVDLRTCLTRMPVSLRATPFWLSTGPRSSKWRWPRASRTMQSELWTQT